MTTIIAIGSDHAGFNLKEKIIKHLGHSEFEVLDFGTHDTNSCDYPVFAKKVAQSVVSREAKFGILVCGTGVGMAMAANKIRGIRAANVENTFCAHSSRLHNNANILCLGERVLGECIAYEIVDKWLHTQFEGGRHQTRVDMLE